MKVAVIRIIFLGLAVGRVTEASFFSPLFAFSCTTFGVSCPDEPPSCQIELKADCTFAGASLCRTCYDCTVEMSAAREETAGSSTTTKIRSVTASTNFAGERDLTGQVAGRTVGSGGNVVVTLSGTVDTSNPLERGGTYEWTLDFHIEGVGETDGEVACADRGVWLFEAPNGKF